MKRTRIPEGFFLMGSLPGPDPKFFVFVVFILKRKRREEEKKKRREAEEGRKETKQDFGWSFFWGVWALRWVQTSFLGGSVGVCLFFIVLSCMSRACCNTNPPPPPKKKRTKWGKLVFYGFGCVVLLWGGCLLEPWAWTLEDVAVNAKM